MPPPPTGNRKRNRTILIAAGALGLLVVLYLRSRAQSPNATSSTDAQGAFMQGAQQQAQQDAQMYGGSGNVPSTFADNGASAGALGDAVTQGLGQVSTALGNLQDQLATTAASQAGTSSQPSAGAPASVPAVSVPITVNTTGQPAGGPASAGPSQTRVATITTHPGGPFFTWFQRAYGRPPPATLPANDPRYLAWTHRPAAPKTGATSQRQPKVRKR